MKQAMRWTWGREEHLPHKWVAQSETVVVEEKSGVLSGFITVVRIILS